MATYALAPAYILCINRLKTEFENLLNVPLTHNIYIRLTRYNGHLNAFFQIQINNTSCMLNTQFFNEQNHRIFHPPLYRYSQLFNPLHFALQESFSVLTRLLGVMYWLKQKWSVHKYQEKLNLVWAFSWFVQNWRLQRRKQARRSIFKTVYLFITYIHDI